ncbi:MAG: hypothetical protein KAH38_12705, partial [Candidatus Hydrogenedentes bacterium]|nr:hypothetical protein [Candidatus Hydrogenedentota bacterium]
MNRLVFILLFLFLLIAGVLPVSLHAEDTAREWLKSLRISRDHLLALDDAQRPRAVITIFRDLEQDHPVFMDWLLQDAFRKGLWEQTPAGGQPGYLSQSFLVGGKLSRLLINMNGTRWRRMLTRVLAGLKKEGIPLPKELEVQMPPLGELSIPELVALYLRACEIRREHRLAPLQAQQWDGIVFAQHYNMGASHYAYTEGLSDAQNERHFFPGATLTVLRFDGTRVTSEILLEDRNGVIRDVDVSGDGSKILFAWKKSDFEDDYSLYEMEMATRRISAITGDLGHADYEAAYLPDGDIVFNSTRCVQTVDCWWTEVSNLYTCA